MTQKRSTPKSLALANKKADIAAVLPLLLKEYPDPSTGLTYASPFQLLAAVILSAQCTDARVNQTTPELFRHYPTAARMAKAPIAHPETLVKSCGFYKMKAKALKEMATSLVENFRGEVPQTIEELTSLRGVGRKTASVVLNQAFSLPAIAVDTHVKRVANRLGWAKHPNPEKIEAELKQNVPQKHWADINGLLILHGRRTCKARRPLCEVCPIRGYCDFFKSSGANE